MEGLRPVQRVWPEQRQHRRAPFVTVDGSSARLRLRGQRRYEPVTAYMASIGDNGWSPTTAVRPSRLPFAGDDWPRGRPGLKQAGNQRGCGTDGRAKQSELRAFSILP